MTIITTTRPLLLSRRKVMKSLNLQTAVAFSVMTFKTNAMCGHDLSQSFDYTPPVWAKDSFSKFPKHGRLQLSNLPTPLYKLSSKANHDDSSILKKLEAMGISLYVKRDDMSGGVETGGNKIRKLEFLLADALARDYTAVVTIGGEQSNHCRATAAAARMVGLGPHLILRTKRADNVQKDPNEIGFTGNVLFDRMVGSQIYTCTPGEYGRMGSQEMVSRLCKHLTQRDGECKPYPIPVGGSNGIGTWGYINGVEEMLAQWGSIESEPSLDHVVFACGSGGTAAGIGLGLALAHQDTNKGAPPGIHAIGVCDSPDYFYGHVAKIADEMGFHQEGKDAGSTEDFVRKALLVHQGKGLGYAVSTPEELDFITKFAVETGIVLDPVYSGKALYQFVQEVLETDEGEKFRGKNVLFWHTGGALGLFEQAKTLNFLSSAKRLDIYGKDLENGIDISD
ncbi:unnamed protein product [Cylindrotheca closterium]|uniref:Tryptophan synthase beta chain-like PALP domain-containing protein n=1 Tax=Cylindrotheca closterium TaxID=2856 RepID=A0AAD2JHS6_9STRA|nr:unnamed protein product [Cylindrotheca closterium]